MISASHNPFYDNGIKLLNGNGQKIEAEIEERIEATLMARSRSFLLHAKKTLDVLLILLPDETAISDI